MFGQVISTYTRSQAIQDGNLFDVSATAREVGLKVPTAITQAVWSDIQHSDETIYDGRLWDILFMAWVAIKSAGQSDRAFFDAKVGGEVYEYWAMIGPGDRGECVLTIMARGED